MNLLKEIKEYFSEGGELLQEDEILDLLRELANNEEVSIGNKVLVLTVAQEVSITKKCFEMQNHYFFTLSFLKFS